MLISDLLETKKGRAAVSIAPTECLSEAMKLLYRHHVGSLIVTDPNGTLIGILTERDIVRTLADTGRRSFRLTVANAMTSNVKTCTPSDTPEHAMTIMARYQIRHLPVVVEGKVVGMISSRDLMQHSLDKQSQEATVWLTIGRCRPRSVARHF